MSFAFLVEESRRFSVLIDNLPINEDSINDKDDIVCPHRMRWLVEHSKIWRLYIPYWAVVHGEFNILKGLKQMGCLYGDHLVLQAAGKGNVEIIQWLLDQGCKWQTGEIGQAARYGHFETVKWLRQKGCPYRYTDILSAKHGGHKEIISWMKVNGCPTE